MPTIRRFEVIEAWQKARLLVRQVYAMSSRGGFCRDFTMKDQVRRAALSVMGNIAEGFERDGSKEFLQFLAIAKGSCGEMRSHMCAALDQGYVGEEEHAAFQKQGLEVSRMIAGLMKYLRESSVRGHKYR